jgi:hypothetical protein
MDSDVARRPCPLTSGMRPGRVLPVPPPRLPPGDAGLPRPRLRVGGERPPEPVAPVAAQGTEGPGPETSGTMSAAPHKPRDDADRRAVTREIPRRARILLERVSIRGRSPRVKTKSRPNADNR